MATDVTQSAIPVYYRDRQGEMRVQSAEKEDVGSLGCIGILSTGTPKAVAIGVDRERADGWITLMPSPPSPR